MRLYLIQHGEARSEAEDPNRSLTERGREETSKASNLAKKLGVRPYRILHSGKLRAQQTAQIIAGILGLREPEATQGLNPNDDVHPWVEHISTETEDLMLVGHLPFMDKLASLLVCGNENAGLILFRYSAIVCLEKREERRWSINWILTPEMG